MTLPTGQISMSQVNVELGRGATAALDFNDGGLRNLAGVASGPISFSSLRGKSSYTGMTVTGYDVYDEDSASGVQYTGSWFPSVGVSGGSGGYSYAWSFISNSGGFTMTVSTGSQAQVRHSVTKFGYQGSCVLNCAVTDNTGHVVNKTVYVEVNIYDGTVQ